MGTPKKTRCLPVVRTTGDRVHVYSDPNQIILQFRHRIPTEEDVLGISFKAAVLLSPIEAVTLAAELFSLASARLATEGEAKIKN